MRICRSAPTTIARFPSIGDSASPTRTRITIEACPTNVTDRQRRRDRWRSRPYWGDARGASASSPHRGIVHRWAGGRRPSRRSPAVRDGSSAVSSPIRTKPRRRLLGVDAADAGAARRRIRGNGRSPWPKGRCKASRADYAVAVTGIAGPDGGTPGKPVGIVCFGWASRDGPTMAATRHFSGDRACGSRGVCYCCITRTYKQNRSGALGPRD